MIKSTNSSLWVKLEKGVKSEHFKENPQIYIVNQKLTHIRNQGIRHLVQVLFQNYIAVLISSQAFPYVICSNFSRDMSTQVIKRFDYLPSLILPPLLFLLNCGIISTNKRKTLKFKVKNTICNLQSFVFSIVLSPCYSLPYVGFSQNRIEKKSLVG